LEAKYNNLYTTPTWPPEGDSNPTNRRFRRPVHYPIMLSGDLISLPKWIKQIIFYHA
jgi:hypothetical protein